MMADILEVQGRAGGGACWVQALGCDYKASSTRE